jgi:FtsH-binding integral membrane protein
MEFLKSTAGKIISGLVGLAVVAGGISWWRMDEPTRHMLLSGTGKIFAWFGIVLFVPWATFFIIGRVAKTESNLAGGLLVLAYTILEVVLLAWLFDWKISGSAAWTFVAFGGLVAAVYNLFTCDWIAEKFE